MPGGKHPPPEVVASWPEPNYVNPERRPIGPVIACTILSAVTVIVLVTRLISKFFVVRRPGWDDYLIILSTFMSLGILAVIHARLSYDGNVHIWDQRPETAATSSLLAWVGSHFFIISIGSTKISVLIFYNRIFKASSGNTFIWLYRCSFAFIAIYTFLSVLGVLISCRPISAYWLQYQKPEPYGRPFKCNNEGAGNIAVCVANTVTDFWITSLPLFFLRNIQVPNRKKIPILMIFGAGYIVCIMSIIRTNAILSLYFRSYDVTWHGYTSWSWTLAEASCAIICASAPMVKPVLRHRIVTNLALPCLGPRHRSPAPSDLQLPAVLRSWGLGKKSRSRIADGDEEIAMESHSSGTKQSRNDGTWLADPSLHSQHGPGQQDAAVGVWEEPDKGQGLHALRSPERAIVKEDSFEIQRTAAGDRDAETR